ncbi:MAG: hypothetical protein V3S29_04740, partial [bacterium]
RSYVLTSFIFMLPGTAGYIYLGYAGREVLVGGGNLAVILPIALAVFAGLVGLPIAVRRWRAARGR